MNKWLYIYYRCDKHPFWVFDRAMPRDCIREAERRINHLNHLSQLHGTSCFIIGGTIEAFS